MNIRYWILIQISILSINIFPQSKILWENKSPMKINRAFHSMAAANGKIYVFGGSTGKADEFIDSRSVEMYNPQSDTWTSKADMPEAITTTCAAATGNKIYIVGGQQNTFTNRSSKLFIYDCATDKWRKGSSLNIARAWHSLVLLNNKLYAIGGRESDDEIKNKSRDSLAVYTIEEYDITSDKWIIKKILPFKHFSIGAAVVNNNIYILSDTTNNFMLGESAIMQEYDPEKNILIMKAKLTPSRCDVPLVSSNNKIYVFGGWHNKMLSAVTEYNLLEDKWMEIGIMPYFAQNRQAVKLEDKIYITGGIEYLPEGLNKKKTDVIAFKIQDSLSQYHKNYIYTSGKPEIFSGGIVNGSGPTFTCDGCTVYTHKWEKDKGHTIYVSEFINGKWTSEHVAEFSGKYDELEPYINHDGSKLFFYSMRPSQIKHEDGAIWYLNKTDKGWGEPAILDSPITIQGSSSGVPSVSANGNLYFGSTRRNGCWPWEIYFSKLVNGRYSEPLNINDTINKNHLSWSHCIDPQENYLIFCSERPDGYGDIDLYISFRINNRWTPAINMGQSVNTNKAEVWPRLSRDGKYLFFNRQDEDKKCIYTLPIQPLILSLQRKDANKK